MNTTLEHLNISVKSPRQVAECLCRLFDWKMRWEGEGIYQGYTVHVGDQDRYLALYEPKTFTHPTNPRYFTEHAINHIGLVTQQLDSLRQRIAAENLTIHDENDIAPGKRIYFMLAGIEFEVVEY